MSYSMYAGDQSACPDCREKVRLKMEKRDLERAVRNLEQTFWAQCQWRG